MAGSFRNYGPAKNIQECIHNCCMAKECDVAMMASNRCYGVRCYNSTMCSTVPAEGKAAEQDMQIAHVTPKGNVNIGKYYTEVGIKSDGYFVLRYVYTHSNLSG